jgi:hypothetical protein
MNKARILRGIMAGMDAYAVAVAVLLAGAAAWWAWDRAAGRHPPLGPDHVHNVVGGVTTCYIRRGGTWTSTVDRAAADAESSRIDDRIEAFRVRRRAAGRP